MLEKYLELLEHNLNWVKRQIREDERMKEITWEKEHEEREKVDELFRIENLLEEIEKEGKK